MGNWLHIGKTTFPNETIPFGWYNGEYLIASLSFDWIAIRIIEANAFDATGLQQLLALSIHNLLHVIEWHMMAFDGLKFLAEMLLYETHESTMILPEHFLEPLRVRLRYFAYSGDSGDGPVLTNLFGHSNFLNLQFIDFHCWIHSMRTIAAANFTGLPVIESLTFTRCGIETIEAGAFDQITATLLRLRLHDNLFIATSFTALRPFLDRLPSNIGHYPKYLQLYSPDEVPNYCSVEFYRMRNMTIISLQYYTDSMLYLYCMNDLHELGPIGRQQQIVHPERWHLPHKAVYKYAFRRFHMRLMAANRTLMIIQSNVDNYRVVIWNIEQRTARHRHFQPFYTWIRTNVECQRRNRTIELIPIPLMANDQNLIAACVIHISMKKQSVPLHCVTIQLMRVLDDFAFNWLYFGLALVIGIGALTLICIFIESMIQTSNTPSTSNDENEL